MNAQAGAYATGILAMMVSGPARGHHRRPRRRQRRATVGFAAHPDVVYALVENVIEKPDGITISLGFIPASWSVSLISRVARTTELRADRIEFDHAARHVIAESLSLTRRAAHHRQQPAGRGRGGVPAKEAESGQ